MAREVFSSRWGLVVAGLGMAVGTGNMWRFPRVAAQNGGAAFLIPWLVFLLAWSVPLMIAEFGLGRAARRGVVGAFATVVGPRFAWMGGFIAVTTVMILFYYSVVTGWTIKYFLAAATGQLNAGDPAAYWERYTTSFWQPVLFHVVAMAAAAFVINRGVTAGIERANRLLIPALFVLLVVAVARAVTLPGAERGLEFLFHADLSALTSYRTWLEALTQSAWSTGAGWGLLLTYAVYLRRDEDIVLNATTIGFGDNSASLLAAMAVLPTAFAVLATDEALAAMAAGNEGLTFIWMPQLFARVPGGVVFLALFFLALFFAALTSLVAMVELATRLLMDAGWTRARGAAPVAVAGVLCGIPSAASLAVFQNQDWVWGLALMISGLFISIAVSRYGARRFREQLIGTSALPFGRVYDWVVTYLVPAEFVGMFGWWMYQAATVYDPEGWWNPVRIYSVGTCVVQWGVALLLLLAFNRRLAAASLRATVERAPEPH